jgi:hypothetical protein
VGRAACGNENGIKVKVVRKAAGNLAVERSTSPCLFMRLVETNSALLPRSTTDYVYHVEHLALTSAWDSQQAHEPLMVYDPRSIQGNSPSTPYRGPDYLLSRRWAITSGELQHPTSCAAAEARSILR